ncbi:MAG: lysylphosphatidylglycerol synthase transmembrane domain-containing protein [bacterium]
MRKWIKSFLAIFILGFLFWYLSNHWHQLKHLLNLTLSEFLLLYLISFLGSLNSSWIVKYLINALGTKVLYWDMFLLQNAAPLLNYLPMKVGTILRANYLKRRYNLSYTKFATFFLYMILLIFSLTTLIGLVTLQIVYGLARFEHKLLAGIFLIVFLISLTFLLVPLPIPTSSGTLSTAMRNFLINRKKISKNYKVLFVCSARLLINFILSLFRLAIIYHSMGKDLHPGGYVILSAISSATRYMGITPGCLGIKELVLGSGASVLGVSLEVGVFAAVIDRAILLSWVFVVGLLCAIWLWHKYPADFKKRD